MGSCIHLWIEYDSMFRSIVHLKDSMKTTARRIPKKKSPEKVPHSLEHTSIRTHSQPHTHSHMHSATPSITHSTHAQSAHRLVQSSSTSSMRSPTPQQLYSKRNPSKPLISKAKLLTLATTSIGLATFFTRATPSIPPPTQAREPTFTDHIPRLSKCKFHLHSPIHTITISHSLVYLVKYNLHSMSVVDFWSQH